MKRLKIIAALFFIFLLLIWLRLFYWQIIRGEALASDALSQYITEYSIYPQRGNILTRDQSSLVTNEAAYLAYAEPKKLPEESEYLTKLANLLELEEASISARLETDKSWVPIKHGLSKDTRDVIANLDISGIGFEEESKRFYPESSSSSHLLGFVGKDVSGYPLGYFGLEGFYNEVLGGKPGFVRQEKDAIGLPIPIGRESRVDPLDGSDLLLYIDRGIQQLVESHLKKGIERYGAKSGGVIVMEPQTGEILAMASLPAYDPSSRGQYDSSLYKNPLIADTYEPGSTFKILVMAPAINEKVVEASTVYDESGPVEIQGYKIRTWNNEYTGKITMTQVLERSSNVGMVFVGGKLGVDKFYEYLTRFKFGQKTGIDLQEEVSSKLRPKNEWRKIDLATASFGQGIAVTPIQLIRAAATLANGGLLVTPRVAAEIRSIDGEVVELETLPPEQVIAPSTAAILSEMMVSAVENGEAKWAKPAGFRIAGKTGTAQVPIAGHYDPDKTIASFIGFAPVDEPEFIMLVVLREPTSSPWGSETAAPLFFDIARDLFAYLDISPR